MAKVMPWNELVEMIKEAKTLVRPDGPIIWRSLNATMLSCAGLALCFWALSLSMALPQ